MLLTLNVCFRETTTLAAAGSPVQPTSDPSLANPPCNPHARSPSLCSKLTSTQRAAAKKRRHRICSYAARASGNTYGTNWEAHGRVLTIHFVFHIEREPCGVAVVLLGDNSQHSAKGPGGQNQGSQKGFQWVTPVLRGFRGSSRGCKGVPWVTPGTSSVSSPGRTSSGL